MYTIEKKNFGFYFTFGGFIKKDEMEQWAQEVEKAFAKQRGPFGLFVDMRTLKPLPTDSQEVMVKTQKLSKQIGMVRAVVILNDALTTMQFKRLAKASGVYEWERYIDASSTPNWEQVGLKWVVDGTDPDL